MFKRWDDQLVLCYSITAQDGVSAPPEVKAITDSIDSSLVQIITPDPILPAPDAHSKLWLENGKTYTNVLFNFGKGKGGKPQGGDQQGGGNSPSKSGGAGAAAVQIASQVLPLAAMLPGDQRAQLEYVTDAIQDERQQSLASNKDVQFRLRSVADIIKYLGAMIKDSDEFKSGVSTYFRVVRTQTGSQQIAHRIENHYADEFFYQLNSADNDYTSEVIRALSELVSARKLSSDIATTKAGASHSVKFCRSQGGCRLCQRTQILKPPP